MFSEFIRINCTLWSRTKENINDSHHKLNEKVETFSLHNKVSVNFGDLEKFCWLTIGDRKLKLGTGVKIVN